VNWRPPRSSVSTAPPCVAILLSLEAPPRVFTDAQNDVEASRLADWFLAHDDLNALIDEALRIREDWRRRDAA
jgi:hypothetical protein